MFFCLQGILTPFNEVMIKMNGELLSQMQGENHEKFSADSADMEDQTLQEYSTESLQCINLPSLVLSKLSLKIGALIILLRNSDQPNGLNNGSRMIVECISRHIIVATLLGGDHNGKMRLILQIPLTSLESDLAFILTRR